MEIIMEYNKNNGVRKALFGARLKKTVSSIKIRPRRSSLISEATSWFFVERG